MTPYIKQALHFLRDNALPMIPVAICEGPGGALLLAGEERWTRYFLQRFHGEKWIREELGRYRAWQMPGILARYRSKADIVIARLDIFSTRLLRMPGYLRVPEWVRMVARVPDADKRYTYKSVRSDLRDIKKNGLTWRVSHDPQELRLHLERDYYSYTRQRHGDDASFKSRCVVAKAFKKGGLLIVENKNRPVAGLVFEHRKDTMELYTIACTGADTSLLAKGALAAIYAFSFEYARSKGLAYVDMRGCRPCPADSLFFVKQKWGAAVSVLGGWVYDLLVLWEGANDRVLSFLEKTPLVFRDNGEFSVIGTSGGESVLRWKEAGLSRFRAVDGGNLKFQV